MKPKKSWIGKQTKLVTELMFNGHEKKSKKRHTSERKYNYKTFITVPDGRLLFRVALMI